jgi:hypothetical protein
VFHLASSLGSSRTNCPALLGSGFPEPKSVGEGPALPVVPHSKPNAIEAQRLEDEKDNDQQAIDHLIGL